MHRLIIAFWVGAISTSTVVPAQASQALNVEEACNRGIFAARNRVAQGRPLSVKVNVEDQSTYIKGYPSNRRLRVVFAIEGAATSSVMNSPQFMKAISANVITSCRSVSAVTFGAMYTGWAETFGLVQNNQVKQFECVEPGIYRDFLPYGYQVCGL